MVRTNGHETRLRGARAPQLFNHFTMPYKLSECSLALVHSAAYRNPELVEQLWRDIIRREPSVESLAAKVAELGHKFMLAESVFPVAGLAYLLERHALQLGDAGGAPGWPVLALADAGIPYAQLFDVYRRLAERVRARAASARRRLKAPLAVALTGIVCPSTHVRWGLAQAEWKVEGLFLHLVQSIQVLVERWLDRVRAPVYGASHRCAVGSGRPFARSAGLR